ACMLGPPAPGAGPGAEPDRPPMPDTPATEPDVAAQWLRLWRGWLRPQWPLLAIALATTLVVSGAQGAYAKLIQLVMAAFEGGDTSAAWWAPLAVIALTSIGATAQYFKDICTAHA